MIDNLGFERRRPGWPFVLIYIGFFLLPFENLAFAPSSGWPALTPVFTFFFFVVFYRYVGLVKKELVLLFGFLGWSAIGWLATYVYDVGNRYFIRDLLSGFFPLIMGLGFYKTFLYLARDEELFNRCIRWFLVGSWISIFISLFILLFGYIWKIGPFLSLMSYVLKRNFEFERFSFLFAEPSFLSVYILGFLVPLIWFVWYRGDFLNFRRLLKVFFVYLIVGFLFVESVRFRIDMLVLVVLTAYFFLVRGFFVFRNSSLLLSLGGMFIVAALISLLPGFISDITLGRVVYDGDMLSMFSSDPSLASRFFRVNALLEGMNGNYFGSLFGVGFGNVGYLVDIGFSEAWSNFDSSYTKELFDILNNGNGSNVYNMYARFAGEFGFPLLIVLVFALYDRSTAYVFFLVMWAYVQFDSYAFYGVWVYLAMRTVVRQEKHSGSKDVNAY